MKRPGQDADGNFIHDTACVHDSVVMGRGNYFGPGVIVGQDTVIGNHNEFTEDVVIGADVKVRSHVELRAFTVVGDGCVIDSGVISSGKNEIGRWSVIRYHVILARGCKIGESVYICPQVMTNNLGVDREPVGGAHIGDWCFIGTQSVLAAGIILAPNTIIGSCSNVTKSIEEPGHLWFGNPAKDRGGMMVGRDGPVVELDTDSA